MAYELQTWYTDGRRRPASATGAMSDLSGQRSRSQGNVISLSRLGPMLYLCHYKPAGHTVSAEPCGHISSYYCDKSAMPEQKIGAICISLQRKQIRLCVVTRVRC